MNPLSKSNLVFFTKTSIIITIISVAVLFYLSFTSVLPQKTIYLYPILFLAVNFLVHFLLLKGSEKSPQDFINYFLIGTTAKLFIYFIFLIIYIMAISKTNNKSFAAVFFILYVLFTSIEVSAIIKHIKNLNKAKTKT